MHLSTFHGREASVRSRPARSSRQGRARHPRADLAGFAKTSRPEAELRDRFLNAVAMAEIAQAVFILALPDPDARLDDVGGSVVQDKLGNAGLHLSVLIKRVEGAIQVVVDV